MFESLLKTQVQNAMGLLGQTDGLAPAHTYVRVDTSGTTYDASTGTVTESSTSYPDIPMVLARYKTEEIDDDKIVVTDQKAVIAALDLPVSTPQVQDKIVLSDGRVFMVMDYKGVPGESVWIIQIRETE